MAGSTAPHPIAAVVVAVLMLGGIGYGVFRGLVEAPKNDARLEQALFEPYFKALSEGHIDEAWQRYTTPRYKQLFPIESYRKHWQQTFSQSGHIAKRSLFAANEAYEPASQRKYTSVKYQLTFDHDYVQAVYEVVPDAQGTPLIDWAGRHPPASSYSSQEPW
jgi:hypothetical protein